MDDHACILNLTQLSLQVLDLLLLVCVILTLGAIRNIQIDGNVVATERPQVLRARRIK